MHWVSTKKAKAVMLIPTLLVYMVFIIIPVFVAVYYSCLLYTSHGTDKALLGGILGFETDDPRIRESFRWAQEQGLSYSYTTDEETVPEHPNTVDIEIRGCTGREMCVRGESTGGGKIKITRINGIHVEFTGEYSTLIIKQADKPGVCLLYTSRCV